MAADADREGYGDCGVFTFGFKCYCRNKYMGDRR